MSGDPFAILGVEARFDLSRAEIERAYLARTAATHPDRTNDENEPAAVLNNARELLHDSERRAVALLRLLGGPEPEADKSLPPGFLMTMMEAREAMEAELHTAGREAAVRWRAWAKAQRAEIETRVAAMFREANPPLAAIRRELNAWRYIERLAEQIEPA
ncbi:MAG: hypothetical protein HBSAPP03_22770 [Phycisphaerae bacterium]|nr:MAG: hypothetical protein HBSAPP03_22770 [Phycisphaerae bacterium]